LILVTTVTLAVTNGRTETQTFAYADLPEDRNSVGLRKVTIKADGEVVELPWAMVGKQRFRGWIAGYWVSDPDPEAINTVRYRDKSVPTFSGLRLDYSTDLATGELLGPVRGSGPTHTGPNDLPQDIAAVVAEGDLITVELDAFAEEATPRTLKHSAPGEAVWLELVAMKPVSE
jgi:hypothetical protein